MDISSPTVNGRGVTMTETRAKLEMLSDIWNDLKELEAKISDLYGYIYYKELEKQREKESEE